MRKKATYIKPQCFIIEIMPTQLLAESLKVDKDDEHDDWGEAKPRFEEFEPCDSSALIENLW